MNIDNENTLIQPGAIVRIKNQYEILQSLDKSGTCHGLPIMNEMFQFCGRIFKVYRHLSRVYIEGKGICSHTGSYILKGVKCDGSYHDDCQRSCNLLWKSSWFELIPQEEIIDNCEKVNQAFVPYETRCQVHESILLANAKKMSFWTFLRNKEGINYKHVLARVFSIFRHLFQLVLKFYRMLKSKNSVNSDINTELGSGDFIQILSKSE